MQNDKPTVLEMREKIVKRYSQISNDKETEEPSLTNTDNIPPPPPLPLSKETQLSEEPENLLPPPPPSPSLSENKIKNNPSEVMESIYDSEGFPYAEKKNKDKVVNVPLLNPENSINYKKTMKEKLKTFRKNLFNLLLKIIMNLLSAALLTRVYAENFERNWFFYTILGVFVFFSFVDFLSICCITKKLKKVVDFMKDLFIFSFSFVVFFFTFGFSYDLSLGYYFKQIIYAIFSVLVHFFTYNSKVKTKFILLIIGLLFFIGLFFNLDAFNFNWKNSLTFGGLVLFSFVTNVIIFYNCEKTLLKQAAFNLFKVCYLVMVCFYCVSDISKSTNKLTGNSTLTADNSTFSTDNSTFTINNGTSSY